MAVDPAFGYLLRQSAFMVPLFLSLIELVMLWREAELFGPVGLGLVLWFIIAAVTQLSARSAGVWAIGLAAQTVLAIVLVLKKHIDDIW